MNSSCFQGGVTGLGEEFEDDLEIADAESSLTKPVKASSLRVNGFTLLHGNPCKIVSMATSKPGKHGHAKILFVGMDVFTGKRYEEISQAGHTMYVPLIDKKEYIVSVYFHFVWFRWITCFRSKHAIKIVPK